MPAAASPDDLGCPNPQSYHCWSSRGACAAPVLSDTVCSPVVRASQPSPSPLLYTAILTNGAASATGPSCLEAMPVLSWRAGWIDSTGLQVF